MVTPSQVHWQTVRNGIDSIAHHTKACPRAGKVAQLGWPKPANLSLATHPRQMLLRCMTLYKYNILTRLNDLLVTIMTKFHKARYPPSTAREVPVVKLASSDARNATAAATSSGLPNLQSSQKRSVAGAAYESMAAHINYTGNAQTAQT